MAAYTTIDDQGLYFNTITWTGISNTANRNFTGVGFQPDFVWSTIRDDAYHNNIYDSVRTAGSGKELVSDSNAAEGGGDGAGYGYISSFTSDGFNTTAGTASGGRNLEYNQSGNTFVAWCWKAGTSFTNDASATSVGNTDSSGSASSTAGFSISIYAGVGSSLDITVKHGLSVAPAVMWVKNRASDSWAVYHHKNTSAPETDYLKLDTTSATTDDADAAETWHDTAPTSAIATFGDFSATNRSGDNHVGYFWNEVQGFSKFGRYTGNANADGPFIYLGFKPAWFMTKKSNGAKDWNIYDNKRSDSGGGNENDQYLEANTTTAEQSGQDIDFLSNGVKIRSTDSEVSGDDNLFVYMAFAESPFCNSNGVPNNAE